MRENHPDLDGALEGIDEHKRSTLRRLIGTGAFVTPAVVSFAMADLSIDAFMHVAAANVTTAQPTTTTTTGAPGTTTTTTTGAPGTTTTTTTLPPGHPAKS
ncbi:hypothetical protein [Bradyrhizobium sp. HKCCYLR20261]|uniref:hypothetical protein n=1 Tax=Bradyrhizobium sp. HKCCYLR20261 TaxID=3420760 RepID=UPI003EB9F5C5